VYSSLKGNCIFIGKVVVLLLLTPGFSQVNRRRN